MSILNGPQKVSSNKALEFKKEPSIDAAVCKLFDAVYLEFNHHSFTSNPKNIRQVLETKTPANLSMHYGLSDFEAFSSSYFLRRFFDRFIFDHELDDKDLMRGLSEGAVETFKAVNEEGFKICRRFMKEFPEEHFSSETLWVLQRARKLIASVLGRSIEYGELINAMGDGPNASFGVKRADANLVSKRTHFDGTASVLRLYEQIPGLFSGSELIRERVTSMNLLGGKLEEVAGSRMSFVPKSFKSFRSIAVEPTLNMRLQLGIGRLITKRLKKVGIDLETQQDVHRKMVKLITKHDLPIATVDWSQASDRLWYSLVTELLSDSPEWLWLMDIARCKSTILPNGEEVTLSMYSTMGNGFTFPLETLLFWSICTACTELVGENTVVISVFGDDCILPSSAVIRLMHVAEEIGWKLNYTKSYAVGPFRESCGLDAYKGWKVNGPRLEKTTKVNNRLLKLAMLYSVVNQTIDHLVYLTGNDRSYYLLKGPMSKFLEWMSASFSTKLHCVPMNYGDRCGLRMTLQDADALSSKKQIFFLPGKEIDPIDKIGKVYLRGEGFVILYDFGTLGLKLDSKPVRKTVFLKDTVRKVRPGLLDEFSYLEALRSVREGPVIDHIALTYKLYGETIRRKDWALFPYDFRMPYESSLDLAPISDGTLPGKVVKTREIYKAIAW